ncbi:hypothetical protein B0T26DRAFT_676498 [Lasiosphaeria miniovina]|uniref:Cyclin n=1 Tax=Lasiosphaeria miniovina TaxID=1954250 RepID=A0AA40AM21_9PEZI|nr:uncharacterized protein B0T26DRAFT_676498 [Lasiosphaeria miniovina]KAK0718319.1 hypothetical protein B0T26DRAFT_676498 [Lasiosphaeria miniovina]
MAGYASHHSDDDFDLDDEYFARTYRPLSNLPTPPPSSRDSSAIQSPKSLLEDGGLLDSALLGPAVHLVNLVPPAASLTLPSVSLVHEMLTHADLPLDTVALAVCILDSLSSRFSLNWRLICPLAQREPTDESAKRYTMPASPVLGTTQLHIDCVNPEVIILASLVISVKFLEDRQEPMRYYRAAWGKNMWTCEQINVTERCIMEALGYRILPLWDQRLIADAMGDMERAGRQALLPLYASNGNVAPHSRSMSTGKAVFGLGLQPTPAETPVSENCPMTQRNLVAGDDLKAAFRSNNIGAAILTCDSLYLPPVRAKRKKSFSARR